MCNLDCNFKYYSFDTQEYINIRNLGIFHTKVIIYQSNFPDILVRHESKMNLIGFFCNFGDLLGMWLGVLVFKIFRDIIRVCNKITSQNYNKLIISNSNRLIHSNCFFMGKCIIVICLLDKLKPLNMMKFIISFQKEKFSKLKTRAKLIFNYFVIFVFLFCLIYQVQIIYYKYTVDRTDKY